MIMLPAMDDQRLSLCDDEVKREGADVAEGGGVVAGGGGGGGRRRRVDKRAPSVKKSKLLKEVEAAAVAMGDGQVCSVCGDYASGFHYSALTCEACKSFFKRTVQDKHEYACSGSFDCPVSKSLRKSCQYCRFQKCLRNGMLLQDVRMDRTRGGRKKCKRTSREQFDQLVEEIAVPGAAPAAVFPVSVVSPPMTKPSRSARSLPPPPPPQRSPAAAAEPLESFIREALANDCISRPLHVTPTPRSPAEVADALKQWFDRGLECVVVWSNSLRCLDVLLLQDRISLLTKNWFAVLLMDTLARSLPFTDDSVHFAANLVLRPSDAEVADLPNDFFHTIQGMFQSLDSLQLDRSELSMLKVLTLFDHSIVDDIGVISRTESLRSATLRALYRVCARKLGASESSDECDLYVSKLLLRQGFCVNLKMGLESWRMLEPPSVERCAELIAHGLGIPVTDLPHQCQQTPQAGRSPAEAEDTLSSDSSCPDQFRSRVYFKTLRRGGGGSGQPTPPQGVPQYLQPGQQQQPQYHFHQPPQDLSPGIDKMDFN